LDNEIKKYASIIWHWAWLIILGALVAGGAAYLYSSNQTPIYSTSARLLIDEAPGGSSGNEYSQILLEQKLATTYIELIRTRTIMEKTIAQLGLDINPAQLTNNVSVRVPPDTQILIITVQDTDPARAAALANTIGEVFTSETEARENLRYAGPIENWRTRLEETALEVEAAEAALTVANESQTTDSPESMVAISLLDTRLKEAQIRYTEAFNNLNELNVAQAKESSNLVPIESALVPRNPISPRIQTNTLLAMVVGAMLAVGIIFLIEYMDDTVKTPDDVTNETGLSTLGAIAKIKHNNETLPDRLITKNSPRDPISEAYRVLRTNLGFSAVDDGLNSMLVTSSTPSEGKSTTAANVAIVMAQTGKRVILVDADLRRPVQHKIFDISNNRGLTTAILDTETSIKEHIEASAVNNLYIMSSGPIPPNPSELLNSQRMEQLLLTLQKIADFVIFDTPPVLTVTDSTILAPKVGGTLLVVDTGNTRRSTLMQASELLNNSNGHIYGVVLNRLQASRRGYYNYYYYSKYQYQYQYEDGNRKKRLKRSQNSRLPKWMQR